MSSTAPSKKRKSGAADGKTSAKKAKANDAHATAKALVEDILANRENYPISEDDSTVQQTLLDLAEYARFLETELAGASKGAITAAPAQKSPEELVAAAEKIQKAAHSGIVKQMAWKPSCKTGSAKWVYDGICSDPAIFAKVLGLDGAPTWKMKKFPQTDFENCIGHCTSSKRFNVVRLTSDVNVRWSADTGEFKFSGSYGI